METAILVGMIGSTVLGAVQQVQQGKAESAALRAAAAGDRVEAEIAGKNAEQARLDADQRRQQSADDEAERRRSARALEGQQRANAAGAGITLQGSPLLALSETAEDLARDLDVLRTGSQRDIDRFLAEAETYSLQQKGLLTSAAAREGAARSARSTSLVGAGATLLGGAARVGVAGREMGVF